MSTALKKRSNEEESQFDVVLDKQREYYNKISDTYDNHYANIHALKYRHRVYLDMIGNITFKGLRVLDAMCGGGQNSTLFSKLGAELTGLDLSENQCKIYQQRFPGAKTICRSITDTGLEDCSFDFIVTESLHHVQPNVEAALDEIFRILKPGGQLLIWEPSAGSILDIARKTWYKFDPKYFEENEESVDVEKIVQNYKGKFTLLDKEYGGNFAYLLVHCSMLFRIPSPVVSLIAPVLLPLDRLIQKIQGKLFSCWVLALFKKAS